MSIERRAFSGLAGGTAIAAGLGGGIAEYAATFEPNNLKVERKQVRLPKLPSAFDGFRDRASARDHSIGGKSWPPRNGTEPATDQIVISL
jgi:hypothetical protein